MSTPAQTAQDTQTALATVYRKINIAQTFLSASAQPNTATMGATALPVPADADEADKALLARVPTVEDAADATLNGLAGEALDGAIAALTAARGALPPAPPAPPVT